MSLLKRLFGMGPSKELEAKSSAVGALKAGASATHWVGLGQPSWTTRSYEQLSTEGYRKNVIAHRAVKTVAEAAASVPFQLYHGDQLVGHHPLLDLLARPNPLQSGVELLEVLYSYLQIAGNGWLESVENATGSVGELYTLRPDRMHIVPGQKGFPVRYDYKVGDKTHSFPVDFVSGESAVLHLKTFHPTNDWYGLSPLEAAAFGIDIHNAASGWNKALFDNAARPSGALVFEPADGQPGSLSDDQFNRLKGELESHYMGSANAGRPFLLEGGLKWQQIAFSPADMEFINAKHVSAREIALAFGVPPMLLGIPGDNTYANYAEANRALWRLTLLPLLEKMVSALNGWLVPRFGADLRLTVDRDSIPALQGEREALWARIGQAGFLTINEKRAALGFPPVDGGDELPNPCGVMPPDMGLSGKGDTPANFKQGLGASASSPNACLDKGCSCGCGSAYKDQKSSKLMSYDDFQKILKEKPAGHLYSYPRVKVWKSSLGTNSRESHRAAHNQVVEVGDFFTVGKSRLLEPRDLAGDVGEPINCRCKVIEKSMAEITKEEWVKIDPETLRIWTHLYYLPLFDRNHECADNYSLLVDAYASYSRNRLEISKIREKAAEIFKDSADRNDLSKVFNSYIAAMLKDAIFLDVRGALIDTFLLIQDLAKIDDNIKEDSGIVTDLLKDVNQLYENMKNDDQQTIVLYNRMRRMGCVLPTSEDLNRMRR